MRAPRKYPRLLPVQAVVLAQVDHVNWRHVPRFVPDGRGRSTTDGTVFAPHVGNRNVTSSLKTLSRRGWIKFQRVATGDDFRPSFVPTLTAEGLRVFWHYVFEENQNG